MRRVFGRIWMLALTLFVLTATVLPASAATVMQDGVAVTLTTDKSEYSANESSTVTMTGENNNSFSVEDVKLEFKIPGGYNSQTQGDTNATFARLGAGESITQTLAIDPDQSSNVDTGDRSLLGIWGFLAVMSAALVVVLTVLYRKNAKMFSMLLCLVLVASMLPIGALAADTEDGENTKTIILSETVNVDGEDLTVTGMVTYTYKEPLNLASMQIVRPEQYTDAENTAAKELRSYVEQMTGTTLAIVSESEASGAGIYIGATEFAAENAITYPENEFGEGWAIQAVDGNLVLTGQAARGTLYAVYHLLEDVLGVRWWNLWDEYVPTGDALVPMDYSASGVPFMDYRGFHINGLSRQSLNQIRNRENGCVDSTDSNKYGSVESFGYPAHVHTFRHYIPARYSASSNEIKQKWLDMINPNHVDFIEAYPEWFATNVNQTTENDIQLCLSSESLLEELKRILVGTIQLDRDRGAYARYYDISPNDNSNLCECDACLEAIEQYGRSGQLLLFVNELAKAVKDAGYEDVYVETLAYSIYAEPPKAAIEIEDNLVIRFAYSGMDILHDINHSNNTNFKSYLEAWSDIIPEGNLYVWDYGVTGATDGVFTIMYKYGVNYAKFAQEGVNGMFLQMESPIDTDFWDMKYWLNTKLMEDPYLAMDEEGNYSQERYNALMDEFIYGFYGDAAGPYIREYLDYMYEKTASADTRIGHSNYIIEAQWLTVEDILKGAELFDKAYEAAGNDAELLKRLRMASSGFDRAVVENWRKWQMQAKELGIEFALDEQKIGYRLAVGLQEMIEQRGKMDASGEKLLTRYKKYLGDTNPLPEELQGIALTDIHDYPAITNTLHGHSIQEDSTSLLGEAIVVDTNSMTDDRRNTYYKVSDTKGLSLSLIRSSGQTGTGIGTLRKDDIIADGNYHLYEFKNILIEHSYYKYLNVLFRDSLIQNWSIAEDMARLQGKRVDFYLSMKVTGDVTCADPDNYPVYYIDRIIVVEHSFTNYVESSHATATYNGEKLASAYCDYDCGAVHTRTVSGQEVPDFLANVHADQIFGVTLNDSAAWSSSGQFVSDSAAATGTAFKLEDSSGSYGVNTSGNVLPIFVSYNTGGTNYTDHQWTITKSMLDGNTDGGYHFYEAQPTANNKLVHTETSEVTAYESFNMFRNDGLISSTISQQLADRGFMDSEVQVYASIKYEVKNYIIYSYYTYYVDQILIVKK